MFRAHMKPLSQKEYKTGTMNRHGEQSEAARRKVVNEEEKRCRQTRVKRKDRAQCRGCPRSQIKERSRRIRPGKKRRAESKEGRVTWRITSIYCTSTNILLSFYHRPPFFSFLCVISVGVLVGMLFVRTRCWRERTRT